MVMECSSLGEHLLVPENGDAEGSWFDSNHSQYGQLVTKVTQPFHVPSFLRYFNPAVPHPNAT